MCSSSCGWHRAAAKLFALPDFRAILHDHGVLGEGMVAWAWDHLPVAEVTLGTVLLASRIDGAGRLIRQLAAGASAALLLLFCIYIALVPEATFQTVGCGCQGGFALTDLVGSPSRAAAIAINLVLVGMSLLVCASPGVQPARDQSPTGFSGESCPAELPTG